MKKKRFLSVAMTVCLLASSLLPSFIVAPNAWASVPATMNEEAVDLLNALGPVESVTEQVSEVDFVPAADSALPPPMFDRMGETSNQNPITVTGTAPVGSTVVFDFGKSGGSPVDAGTISVTDPEESLVIRSACLKTVTIT